jgi:hypothetical protein
MLFELSTWHALAKLRLHTETTVCELEASTTRLGAILRRFESEVCSAYDTRELPSEEAARVRRRAAKAANTSAILTSAKTGPQPAKPNAKKNSKQFNMGTVKMHSLGGYAKAIRLHGTTDNYSTWLVSLCLFPSFSSSIFNDCSQLGRTRTPPLQTFL